MRSRACALVPDTQIGLSIPALCNEYTSRYRGSVGACTVGCMRTAVRSTGTFGAHCPECSSPAGTDEPYCRYCGIWLAGPQAGELRWIAGELRRVDETRTWLTRRRAVLLGELAGLPRHVPAPGCARAAGEAEAQVSEPPDGSSREPATQPVPRPAMSQRTAA